MSNHDNKCPECGVLLDKYWHLADCGIARKYTHDFLGRITEALEGIWLELEKANVDVDFGPSVPEKLRRR